MARTLELPGCKRVRAISSLGNMVTKNMHSESGRCAIDALRKTDIALGRRNEDITEACPAPGYLLAKEAEQNLAQLDAVLFSTACFRQPQLEHAVLTLGLGLATVYVDGQRQCAKE
jgi:hypothetical protein